MPQTLQSPVNVLNSVDWFKAKLQFEMGPVELKHLMDEGKDTLLVLDVRDAESFAKEHIPGAINIPQADLPKRLNELPKDKTVVTYCWTVTCHLATKACLDLAHHEFKTAEMIGGIREWKANGLPVEGSGAREGDSVKQDKQASGKGSDKSQQGGRREPNQDVQGSGQPQRQGQERQGAQQRQGGQGGQTGQNGQGGPQQDQGGQRGGPNPGGQGGQGGGRPTPGGHPGGGGA